MDNRAQVPTNGGWLSVFDERAKITEEKHDTNQSNGGSKDGASDGASGQEPWQISGWSDIKDGAVWRNAVHDIIKEMELPLQGKAFDAGCGVLAFSKQFQEFFPKWELLGVDGAESCIRRIPQLWPDVNPENFKVGILPNALEECNGELYDLTICHGVLMCLSKEEGLETIDHLLRMTKQGGFCLVSELVDVHYQKETEEAMSRHWQHANYGSEIPTYTYYSEDELINRFSTFGKTWVGRVQVPEYGDRGRYRINLYIRK
uniref:Methyltransferase type 12 domain-containing protein n=1 Tax=Compsopogon caeruleus TaxID=31354 RepID=A0A7S1TL13_9RHOD